MSETTAADRGERTVEQVRERDDTDEEGDGLMNEYTIDAWVAGVIPDPRARWWQTVPSQKRYNRVLRQRAALISMLVGREQEPERFRLACDAWLSVMGHAL